MRKWTDADIAFVRDNYARMSNKDIAAELGFSGNAVRVKANRLGLHKPPIEMAGLTKLARYYLRRVSEGCCPHCGKPCAPYYQCEERREKDRLRMSKGKPRKLHVKAHRKPAIQTQTGFITKVGAVMAHRMAG